MYWASRIYRILSHRWIRVQNTRKVTEISCLSAAVKQLCCENSAAAQVGYISAFWNYIIFLKKSAVNLTVNFPFSRDGFSLSLRYFSVSGNWWHRSTFLFIWHCFALAKLIFTVKIGRRKEKKNPQKLSFWFPCVFLISLQNKTNFH